MSTEKEIIFTYISKVRVDGDSLVVTIPKNWVDYYDLEPKDIIEWQLLNIKKLSESEKK